MRARDDDLANAERHWPARTNCNDRITIAAPPALPRSRQLNGVTAMSDLPRLLEGSRRFSANFTDGELPIRPRLRPLFLTAVLLFGLAAGVTSAGLLVITRQTFQNVRALRSAFSLPVLGAVRDLKSGFRRGKVFLDFFGVTLAAGHLGIEVVGFQPETIRPRTEGQPLVVW